VLTVLALLGVGVVAGRWSRVPDGSARVLDAFVVNVALPGLVIALVPRLEFDPEVAVPVAVAWGTLVVAALAVLALSRVLRWSRAVTGTLLLVVPLGNTSFLGIPAVEQLLGPGHVPYAIIYDQLGSFLALATYGAVIAGVYGRASRPRLGRVLLRVVSFPPFAALVVAVVLAATGVPELVADVSDRLGSTVTPLAMIAVGMRVAIPRRFGALVPLTAALGLRLVALPALVYGIGEVVALSGVAWQTSVLEAAMPPMVTASIIAIDAGLDEELAANAVGAGVLLSMLTLPLWSGLIT